MNVFSKLFRHHFLSHLAEKMRLLCIWRFRAISIYVNKAFCSTVNIFLIKQLHFLHKLTNNQPVVYRNRRTKRLPWPPSKTLRDNLSKSQSKDKEHLYTAIASFAVKRFFSANIDFQFLKGVLLLHCPSAYLLQWKCPRFAQNVWKPVCSSAPIAQRPNCSAFLFPKCGICCSSYLPWCLYIWLCTHLPKCQFALVPSALWLGALFAPEFIVLVPICPNAY